MKPRWIVTPYFYDEYQTGFESAVPPDAPYLFNKHVVPGREVQHFKKSHREIANFVAETVSEGDLAISVSGDCMSSIPVMAGLQKAGLDPLIVWLDAHGDFNTPETSPSGFLGGMPFAMLVGRGDLRFSDQVGQVPVSESDAWLIGGRILALSQTAADALSEDQKAKIEKSAKLVPLAIPTIEMGGGSVRCTIVGVHLARRPS